MARIPRNALAEGSFFHVYARGVDRMAIFRDRDDRIEFLELLALATRRCRWRCHAFCLMDSHVHLVLESALVRVSKGMHLLLGQYAQYFNRRYDRWGHLFGDRFGARLIADEDYLDTVVAYVLANPVVAGIVDRPEEWPWSGPHAASQRRRPSAGAGRLALRAP